MRYCLFFNYLLLISQQNRHASHFIVIAFNTFYVIGTGFNAMEQSKFCFYHWSKDYLTLYLEAWGAVAPGGLSKLALRPPAASLLFQ